MRIIGDIEHPKYKITVFKMDNKLSVKIETGLYEQTYKFRDGAGIDTVADVKALLDPAFMESVETIFSQQHQQALAAHRRMAEATAEGENEFEVII